MVADAAVSTTMKLEPRTTVRRKRTESVVADTERRGGSKESHLRRGLFKILNSLEERRPTGLIVVRAGAEEIGGLAVSKGRLCLAFLNDRPDAPGTGGMALARPAGVRNLYDLAAATRTEGGRITVAIRNGERGAELRRALADETAMGLVEILLACGDFDPSLGLIPARDDYDQTLTLGSVEAFAAGLRTQFEVPWDLAGETLEAVGEEGRAVLLARSRVAGEQAFPVAQAGFEDVALCAFVAVARFASDLNRLREDVQLGANSVITTFAENGESWRCVTSGSRIALLKAPPEALERATAWAHLFVDPRGDGS